MLELDFSSIQPHGVHRGAWWQYAWDEVRRARGEAIQTGVQEHQIVDELVFAALRALDGEIKANKYQQTFQLAIPPSLNLHGAFKFYRVRSVEEGFKVPSGELRILCELSRIDQWRE